MKVLSRYLVKEFLRLLILCEIIFLFLFLIIDFLGKIDNFIEAHVSTHIMLAYFVYKTPFMMVQLLPPASLISVIVMFSLMKKNPISRKALMAEDIRSFPQIGEGMKWES